MAIYAASNKDVDDILWVTVDASGYQVTVTIANATTFAAFDTPLFQKTVEKGVYRAHTTLPMLPRQHSEKQGSLFEGETRPALILVLLQIIALFFVLAR